MTYKIFPMIRALVLPALVLALAGCETERTAEWYMAHGEEMQAEVKQCQANPKKAETQKNCAHATEAFVTWARTSGVK